MQLFALSDLLYFFPHDCSLSHLFSFKDAVISVALTYSTFFSVSFNGDGC